MIAILKCDKSRVYVKTNRNQYWNDLTKCKRKEADFSH